MATTDRESEMRIMAKISVGYAGKAAVASGRGRRPQFLPMEEKLSYAADLAEALRKVGHEATDPQETPVLLYTIADVPERVHARAKAEGLDCRLLSAVRVGISIYDTISSTNGVASLCWNATLCLVVVGKNADTPKVDEKGAPILGKDKKPVLVPFRMVQQDRVQFYIPAGKHLPDSGSFAISEYFAKDHGGIDEAQSGIQIALKGFKSPHKALGAWDPSKVSQFAMFQGSASGEQAKHRKSAWPVK